MSRKPILKLWLCLLSSVLSLGLVGTAYAYQASEVKVNNLLHTRSSAVYMTEIFNTNDLWLPGETKEKMVHFGNTYPLDQVIRFTVTAEWFDNKGTPEILTDDKPWSYEGTYFPAPIVLNWTDEIPENGAANPTWTKIDGYYYYNRVLEAQSGDTPTQTLPVLQSITFSPDISNDGTHSEDFSNKLYRISISMEAVDVNPDITKAAWGVSFTQTGTDLSWTE